jgi:hypothetical protein
VVTLTIDWNGLCRPSESDALSEDAFGSARGVTREAVRFRPAPGGQFSVRRKFAIRRAQKDAEGNITYDESDHALALGGSVAGALMQGTLRVRTSEYTDGAVASRCDSRLVSFSARRGGAFAPPGPVAGPGGRRALTLQSEVGDIAAGDQGLLTSGLLALTPAGSLRPPVRGPIGIADAVRSGGAGFFFLRGGRLYEVTGSSAHAVSSMIAPRGSSELAVGAGSAWVLSRRAGAAEAIRFDLATHKISGPALLTSAKANVRSLTLGLGSLWVIYRQEGGLFLARVDPATRAQAGSAVALPAGVGDSYQPIVGFAAVAGAVWVAQPEQIARVDAASGAVTTVRPPIRTGGPLTGPAARFSHIVAVAAGPDALYATIKRSQSDGRGEVRRLDPVSRTFGDPFAPLDDPGALAVSGTTLWAVDRAGPTIWRVPLAP